MSDTAPSAPSIRTIPARAPDRFWLGHPRYRRYMLFAATGFVLAADAAILLWAVASLGRGPAAWEGFLAAFRTPGATAASVVLLIGTLFFSVRWLRVGVKVPTVRIGLMPAPPEPVVLVAHFAGLLLLTGLLLLILGGIIL